MRISIFRWIPEISFLLLFPAFFFYHSLLAFGVIGPVLGGFFGPVTVILILPLSLMFARGLWVKKIILNKIDLLFFLLIGYSASIVFINYLMSTELNIDHELLNWSLSGFLFNVILYIIARTMNFEQKSFRSFGLLIFCSMSLIVFFNIGDSYIFYLAEDAGESSGVATYQGFGRSLAFMALLLIAGEHKTKNFYLFFSLAAAALFFNGARSELIAFTISAAVLAFLKFKVRRAVAISATLLLLFYISLNFLPTSLIEGNRLFELLNISDSTSAQSRIELTNEAWRIILRSPFFGDYGYYARENGGGIGAYSHNILSAWTNLGLIGFIGWAGFCWLMLKHLMKISYRNISNKNFHSVCIVFWVFTVFILFISKDYSFMSFGFSVGLLARFQKLAGHLRTK